MGTDGPNLKETAKLYDLTEAEQELLLARKRGHALFMVGAKRLHINFEIPDYKMFTWEAVALMAVGPDYRKTFSKAGGADRHR